jgi:Protein of unknown function (DUF4240)
MDEQNFWEIVQRANDISGGNMDRKCDVLRQQISVLSKDAALEFARLFDAVMDKAYHWPLWGAAYVINGGCGDDSFIDFRASLISRGRQAFECALSDPDTLADEDFSQANWFYEGYQYAVTDGVKAAAGKSPQRQIPTRPSGVEWQEDEVYALFPN